MMRECVCVAESNRTFVVIFSFVKLQFLFFFKSLYLFSFYMTYMVYSYLLFIYLYYYYLFIYVLRIFSTNSCSVLLYQRGLTGPPCYSACNVSVKMCRSWCEGYCWLCKQLFHMCHICIQSLIGIVPLSESLIIIK